MNRKILIVEDNEDVREFLLPMLDMWLSGRNIQAELYEAKNGAEALAWIKQYGPFITFAGCAHAGDEWCRVFAPNSSTGL